LMAEPGQLSVNDKVLLHLSRFVTDIPPDEYPTETTQAGIAVAIGISRTHVPRAVKGLTRDGLATELTARVKGHERRMNVYTLTPDGSRRADGIWKTLLDVPFSVRSEGRTSLMTGRDIETRLGRKRAIDAVARIRDGLVEMNGRIRAPVRILDRAPRAERFYGRESELQAMEEFLSSDSRVMVLLGSRGYGTTALASKFAEGQEEADIIWVSLTETVTVPGIENTLIGFGKKIRSSVNSLTEVLGLENSILLFDDYFQVGEDVVEFFSSIVETPGEAKVIITARQETPAYNWFYHKKHIDSGLVQELKVKGIDQESAKRLLGNDKIPNDALRRVVTMTRGQPFTLNMLRNGDEKGLKNSTVLTLEEIRYLMILKDKRE